MVLRASRNWKWQNPPPQKKFYFGFFPTLFPYIGILGENAAIFMQFWTNWNGFSQKCHKNLTLNPISTKKKFNSLVLYSLPSLIIHSLYCFHIPAWIKIYVNDIRSSDYFWEQVDFGAVNQLELHKLSQRKYFLSQWFQSFLLIRELWISLNGLQGIFQHNQCLVVKFNKK